MFKKLTISHAFIGRTNSNITNGNDKNLRQYFIQYESFYQDSVMITSIYNITYMHNSKFEYKWLKNE